MEPAPLRSGDPERMGGFVLTGRIGEGGQGVVYLGHAGDEPGDAGCGSPGSAVAVKVLRTEFAGDAKARARFAAELAAAKRVTPFCTPRIIDADVDGDTPYLVSEYVRGPSLRQLVTERGPLAGGELDRLAIGTLTALAAIHRAGIVHRDFKPSNVLLAADGPRVIDFGIARALDATGTMTSTAVGTPASMAPEQIAAERVGPEADIFAWGGTMVYAATGRPPFGQDSIPAVMNRILHEEPELGDLAGPLRDIVVDCLDKDPPGRPTAHQILLRLLGAALPHPPGPAGAVPTAGGLLTPAALLTAGARAAAGPPPGVAAAPPPPAPPPATPPAATPPAATPPAGRPPAVGRPNGSARSPGTAVAIGAGAMALVLAAALGTYALVRLLPKPGPTPNPNGGTFAMALNGIEAIDPANARLGDELFMVRQLFTGLMGARPDGKVVHRLAESATAGEGCRRWTFRIAAGARFTDGEPVTAESFVRGWSRNAAAEDGFTANYLHTVRGHADVQAGRAATLSGLSAPDERTLAVRLERPDCDFAARTAHPAFMPVPRAAGDPDNARFNQRPIGNGPFRLESWSRGRHLTLVRNDAFAFARPRMERVVIMAAATPEAEAGGFGRGALDWAVVPPRQFAAATATYGSKLVKRDLNGMIYLSVVTDGGPLKSRKARQALSYAIDRAQVSREVFGGHYRPAGGLVPAVIPGFGRRGRCASCDRSDPVRAKTLAAEAGLGAGTVVRLRVDGGPYERAMEAVARQVERTLGWSVRLERSPDFPALLAAHKAGEEGVYPLSWLGDYLSPDTYLYSLLHGDELTTDPGGSLTGDNFPRYRDAGFDAAVDRALRTPDPGARTAAYQEAERIALEDLPLIPLWEYAGVRAADTAGFGDLRIDLDGYPVLGAAAAGS